MRIGLGASDNGGQRRHGRPTKRPPICGAYPTVMAAGPFTDFKPCRGRKTAREAVCPSVSVHTVKENGRMDKPSQLFVEQTKENGNGNEEGLVSVTCSFVRRFCTLATFFKHIWERVRSRRFGNFPSYEHVSANQTMSE